MRRGSASRLVASVVLLLAALGLAACDSSGPGSASVSGSVSGLSSGESVVLELNGGSALTVNTSGVFTLPTALSVNGSYSVTVASQPRGQVCTVANGTGTVTSNVTNVEVTCAAQTFTVAGTLTGLDAGSHVVLENHGADALTLTGDGSFSFSTKVAFDGTYAVTVATQPADAICTVQHGTGAGVTADVTSVAVTCSPNTFTLSGTLSGLTNGMQVTLENNSADVLTLSANGKFTFSTPIAYLGAYNVTVSSEPAGQTCTVTNGQSTQVTANVANITVACSTNTYTIGGSVSGLGTGQQVTLEDNGGDALTVTGNGSFVFTTSLTYGSAYTVTVGTQPTGGLVCLVSNGMGSSLSADVTGVAVNCVANTVSFTTPGSYTWTVPAGLTSISITATGGGGGGGGDSGALVGGVGGAGAVVISTLSVTPGQVLNLVVGGGGGGGTNGPAVGGGGYYIGAGGGGGGSSNVDAGSDPVQLAQNPEIIAGGGGAGGPGIGASDTGAGGNAGGAGGAGGNGGGFEGGGNGGSGGTGGAAGNGAAGGNGSGGPGGAGGPNGNAIPGGSGGGGVGAGAGATEASNTYYYNGGGGGGYGGGGTGGGFAGGGAGGSTGPAGTTYAPASNGGGVATNGGDGSIVITLQ